MKKQELRHDPVRENIVKGVQYINENGGTVLILFAVIVLCIAGISYYKHIGSTMVEDAANITGRAQNTFINGNLDEALVKFQRVLDDYPDTPGAVQSLVYLLNDAITNQDEEAIQSLLSNHDANISDPVVLSAFYKLRGDIALNQGDSGGAVKYYRKAQSNADGTALQTKYKLDIATALLAQDNYDDARETLDEILNNEDIMKLTGDSLLTIRFFFSRNKGPGRTRARAARFRATPHATTPERRRTRPPRLPYRTGNRTGSPNDR